MAIMPEVIVAEGRAARRAGLSRCRNPYRGPDFYRWQQGWQQEKDNPTPPAPEPMPEEEPVTTDKRHHALVAQFERAVEEHAFIGTIPLYSEDDDEQRRINAERRRLTTNLTKTRNNLLRELGREPKFTLRVETEDA